MSLNFSTSVLSPQSSPLFSVVIPHWNAVRFLPTCLDALKRQTYPHIEVIIADNNSTA